MNNALDNLEYENTLLAQENDELKAELRALKSHALFVRECEGDPVIETITIGGFVGNIYNDHADTYRFEIYNPDCDYVESEGGIVHYEAAVRIVTDLLTLYSDPIAETLEAEKKKFRFTFETEMETTLIVEAESYSAAQDMAYQLYENSVISFSNKDIKHVNTEHNVHSVTSVDDVSEALENALTEHQKTLDNLED